MSALVISSEATKPLSLPTTPTHRQYRAIVFTHASTVTDKAGCGTLLSLTVGIYDDAGAAWAAAQEASRTQGGIGHTITVIEPPGTVGTPRTITQAQKLVRGLRQLASELPQGHAETFTRALTALDAVLVSGWTEADEALGQLVQAARLARGAGMEELHDKISTANGYLQRWQGRAP